LNFAEENRRDQTARLERFCVVVRVKVPDNRSNKVLRKHASVW
jgi:hypothetical protein